jgi:hypothetical protein
MTAKNTGMHRQGAVQIGDLAMSTLQVLILSFAEKTPLAGKDSCMWD